MKINISSADDCELFYKTLFPNPKKVTFDYSNVDNLICWDNYKTELRNVKYRELSYLMTDVNNQQWISVGFSGGCTLYNIQGFNK